MSEITEEVKESLRLIEDLKFFLATAPANWQENQVIRRYYLNNDEGFVSCVFWNNLYFVTGTDIVRCILYKFQHFGRTITDRKKFEEGIFSDLRNLKAGSDSVLEEPKLPFLEFLYNNSCLRTQKKQKVFYWFNVPHDKLMADALERDIKKEKLGQTPTSVAVREPAILFKYVEDKKRSLYDQLSEHLNPQKYDEFSFKTESTDDLASPEYNLKQPDPGPQNIPQEQEDEDFPLDYLDRGVNEHDYISLDSNYYTGKYINSHDTNFESIDPGMFLNPVNVASNDDYLIEHTVPLKVGSATLVSFPRLARILDDQSAFFPYPYAPTATGSQFPPSAMIAQFPPSMFDASYFVHEPMMHGNFDVDSYPSAGPSAMAAVPSVVHFEPPPPAQFYGLYDDVEYMRMAVPSQRQQEISASMMKKRKQLQKTRRGVSKPGKNKNRVTEYETKLRQLTTDQENLAESHIPTPESSIVVASDQHHS